MPFALIPEGFELVKVTKAQEQAVQKYYNQERINSLLENPAIPLAVAAASLTGIAGLKLKDYLVSLQLNEKVDKLAKELAGLAPETMQFGLEAYEKQDSKSFDEALPYLKEQIAKCFEGKDAKEGIAAFLEKRKPNWD